MKFSDTLAWYKGLIEKGFMPSVDIALSEQDPLNGYLAGRYALVTDGSWMNGSYLGQNRSPRRSPPPRRPSVSAPASSTVSLRRHLGREQNQDAAWQWVKYLGSADCQDVIGKAAVVFPAVKTSTAKAEAASRPRAGDVTGFTEQVTDGTTKLLPIADHCRT